MWQPFLSSVASRPLPAADSDHGPLTVRQLEQDIEERKKALDALDQVASSRANLAEGMIAASRHQRGLRWLELAVAHFQRRPTGAWCDANLAINVELGLNNVDLSVSAAEALLRCHDADSHKLVSSADELVKHYLSDDDPLRTVQALQIAAGFDRDIVSGVNLGNAVVSLKTALSILETRDRPRAALNVQPSAGPSEARMPQPARRPATLGWLGARAQTQAVTESESDRIARLCDSVRPHVERAMPVRDQVAAGAQRRSQEDAQALSTLITGGKAGAKDALVDLLVARLPRGCVQLLKEQCWGHEMGDELAALSTAQVTAVACSISVALSRSGHPQGCLPLSLLRSMVLCAADGACGGDWHPLREALSAEKAVAALAAARKAGGGESAARGKLIEQAFKGRMTPEDCLCIAIAVYLFSDTPIARYLASYCEQLLGPRVKRAEPGSVSLPPPT